MNPTLISALVTGKVRGSRINRPVHLEIDPARTELDFIPGTDDRPTLARVHQRVWVPQLHRWDWHSELVIQDSIEQLTR